MPGGIFYKPPHSHTHNATEAHERSTAQHDPLLSFVYFKKLTIVGHEPSPNMPPVVKYLDHHKAILYYCHSPE